MIYWTLRISIFAVAFIGSLVAAAGCDSPAVAPEMKIESPARVSAAVRATTASTMHGGLAVLRRATARYHRVETAVEDGFVPAGPCADPPGRGALGVPYVKLDRFDATIDLEQPEVLFYEPRKDGTLRLVGAEPVVLIEAWDGTHDEPPMLFGRTFHRNEAEGLYGLHMWVWLNNPDGVFAFTHPKVSCEFAD